MSAVIEEMTLPESKALLEKYRDGTIGPSEEIELFELIRNLSEKYGKKFKFREILAPLQYVAFDIKRLDSEYSKWLRRQEKQEKQEKDQEPSQEPKAAAATSDKTLNKKIQEIQEGATKGLLTELQELGGLLVTQYAKNASDRGEGLKDYVIKAVEFREQYGEQTEALQQENDMYKALCFVYAQALKPQFKQLAASRIFLEWITGLMQLEALGIDVDKTYVDAVTAKMEEALGIRIL